jgi:signal transduction histidine kinase
VSSAVGLTAIVRLIAVVMIAPVELSDRSFGPAVIALALTTVMATAEYFARDVIATDVRLAVLTLLADLCAVILMVVEVGPGTAAGYHSLGTAALGAALFGVRGVLLALGLGLGVAVLSAWQPMPVGSAAELPARYVLVGILVATVRHLLAQESALRERLRTASDQVARAEERDRLARDLHDSATATLTGMRLSLAGLRAMLAAEAAAPATDPDRTAAAAKLAVEVEAAAHRASFEARLLVSGLRTDADGGDPLAGAVRRTVAAWRSGSVPSGPVEVTLALADVPEPAQEVRTELLAVLREALVNAGRYAAAGTLRIGLVATPSRLRLTVIDDGRGFTLPADLSELTEAGHFGLTGMAERLRGVGGELRVHSSPGAGTAVTAEVPLPVEPAAPPEPRPARRSTRRRGRDEPLEAVGR